ncbi:MAG: LysR family transcriptional regulator, partial [Pseudomonadota bacterium]
MDINKLHYFCTVAQTGSLTQASELLHISQPALSKAIKKLEEELGESLILASGRGIVVTDFGHLLAEKSQGLIREIENLRDLAKRPRSRALRIATFEVFSTYFMSDLVSRELPGRPLEVHEKVPGEIEQALVKRQCDLGITYLPVPHPHLDVLKVGRLKMSIFGTSKWASKHFDDFEFVIPNTPVEGTPTKAKGLDGWPDNTIPRKSSYQVTMLESALQLCGLGLCVGYFPDFIVQLYNQ